MKYYAIHLRDQRTNKGWDQETLAHMAGLSVRTIQRIEAGKSCSLETLKSLSAAIDLKHFSELLPKPQNNDYQPNLWNLIQVFFSQLIVKNVNYSVHITFFLIGGLTTFHAYDQSTNSDIPLTYEQRLSKELAFQASLGKESPSFLHKTQEQIESSIKREMELESRPMNKFEWKTMTEFMFGISIFILVISTVFRLLAFISSYEFYEIVAKPIEEKFTS